MNQTHNTSTKFRAALRKELPLWVQQEILSEEEADRLSTIYQLSSLKEESSSLLSSVIFTIGGLLLGGGFISFVAANWEGISNPLKLALLFSILLGLHITGFWLWYARGWRRLGHALIFCGCLVFGADIGLVAQIFHIRGNWYGAFGAWAIGSLAMAWAVRSWIIGLLVLLTSFIWFTGFHSDYEQLALLYPLGIAISLITLAWTLRSRVLYTTSLLAIITATCFLAGSGGNGSQLLFAMAASALFIWLLGQLHRISGWHREFATPAAALGLSLLAATAYIWSFSGVWRVSPERRTPSLWASVFLLLSIAGAFLLLRDKRHSHPGLIIGVLAAGGLLCGSALLVIMGSAERELPYVMIANLAALILAAVMVGTSLIDERRSLFWLGSLYVVLLILTRFLEYETSLLVKSAAFLACGVAVIFAGMKYEQYIRRKSTVMEPGRGREVVGE